MKLQMGTARNKGHGIVKWLRIIKWAMLALLVTLARADVPTKKPEVDWTPFEPPCEDFFYCRDKFRHPAELLPPKFLYPFEMRRAAIDGEAVVLVKIDDAGYPQKLSVLYGTHPLFIRSAVFALEKARWATGQGNVSFYYKAVFTLNGDGSGQSR